MASKRVLKLSSINEFFENDNKIIKKGENALESNHVLRMQFDADQSTIKGVVLASMEDKSYNIEMTLNKTGDIISANCSCPRGIKCHHIVSMALFGHYNISIIDKECTWNAPNTNSSEVKTAQELYPSKPYSAVNHQVTDEELNDLCRKLSNFGHTVGFTWLLQKETHSNDDISYLPIIDNIILSDDFTKSTNRAEYLRRECVVDDAAIEHIADITTGQGQNEKWFIVRKFRVTSSNFGLILAACKRNRYPESLFKSLIGSYNLDGVKAIQWGRIHEKNGIDFLKTNFNVNIKQTGIWLTNSGILGANPDGLIDDDTIIEIKCPYTYRNDVLSDKLKNDTKYIIYFNDNGEIFINPSHNYYHQIQGNLHITKRKKCLLCIWTLQETITANIEYDPSWAENLLVLEEFFFKQYLPRIMTF